MNLEKKEKKYKKIEYVGKGAFLNGVPARDMTEKEWKKIPIKKRRHAIKLGLYKE